MKKICTVIPIGVATILASWVLMPYSAVNAQDKLRYSCSSQVFEAFEMERLDVFTKACEK